MHDYRCVRNEEMNFNDIIANKSSLAMIIDSRVQKQEKKGYIILKFNPKNPHIMMSSKKFIAKNVLIVVFRVI